MTLAVAESCTGGLLGGRLTAESGSSAYFAGGVIAYANAAKTACLGVSPRVLAREGAVSAAVAYLMASGVRARFGTDLGLAVTGVAGPRGGTRAKPVGLVYIGLVDARGGVVRRFRWRGDREAVRAAAVEAALNMVRESLTGEGAENG